MHMPFLVLEQALSNGCRVLFQPLMVPLPAMGMGNSWFMLVLLWQLNWQNLPFFEQVWLMVGKTWWICFCSHNGFLCVFHLLYTFYISTHSDVAVTWQKAVCLQPALYPGKAVPADSHEVSMWCSWHRSQVHLFRLRCVKPGKKWKCAETYWRSRCADTWQRQWTWMMFWDFNRRKSGRNKQIEEESSFYVWIAEACQSSFWMCLWLQSSCCMFL